MGRTSKWLRSLFLSSKKPSPDSSSSAPARERKKTRRALSKSADDRFKNEDYLVSPCVESQLDANKHAITVAAATAAVAEAALAAAQAAAEVVRLTSDSGSGRNDAAFVSGERRRVLAAVKIQSAFRAYLARRALRALKGLVKLQALVRGHIVRKQSADMLRRMQAMARIQARASAHRCYASEPSKTNIKYCNSGHPGVANRRNYNQHSSNVKQGGSTLKQYNSRSHNSYHLSSNWLDHWMDQYVCNNRHGDDERSDKILEIDTWNPRQTRRNDRKTPTSQYFSAWTDTGHEPSKLTSLSRHSAKLQKPNPSVSSEEISSVISANFPPEGDQCAVWTAENSPRVHSASSRPTSKQRRPFTPTRSECSRSLFGDYFGHPNYMAYTESSRAKVRSQSAPKQRMQLEELRLSRSQCEPDAVSEDFALPANFYRHSGQLKRRGTHGSRDFSSTYAYRL